MKQTAVEWLHIEFQKRFPIETSKMYNNNQLSYEDMIIKAKEMEKDRETRIKELETFLQEDILDDVYYYHSPIWYRATELLNQTID